VASEPSVEDDVMKAARSSQLSAFSSLFFAASPELLDLPLRIILRRRCVSYDRLPALVLSLRDVLASSTHGAGTLSHRLAAVAAFPPGGNRRPRSACAGVGRCNAPGALAERTVPAVANLGCRAYARLGPSTSLRAGS